MDHLAGRVQRALHLDTLAFKLRHFILVVNVVGVAGVRILQHILVPLLYHCSREALHVRGVGFGRPYVRLIVGASVAPEPEW